jgi:hypothetical protein
MTIGGMSMKQKQYPDRNSVEVEFEGKKYEAEYFVERGSLTVSSDWGTKSTHPGPDPGSIARVILRELLEDAKRQGVL